VSVAVCRRGAIDRIPDLRREVADDAGGRGVGQHDQGQVIDRVHEPVLTTRSATMDFATVLPTMPFGGRPVSSLQTNAR